VNSGSACKTESAKVLAVGKRTPGFFIGAARKGLAAYHLCFLV